MMADNEKITINLNVVDLGQIDLLVEQGFYSNRTDFIKTSIRNQLTTHTQELKETITRKTMVVGVVKYDANDLNKILAEKKRLDIKVLGMLVLKDDISSDLALSTIKSIKVFGKIRANQSLLKALENRIIN